MFYTKLDLKNAFWSINIPPSVRGTFVLSVTCPSGVISFATRCLPFGWTWSPILAQRTMLHLLEPCLRLLPTLWIYIDDVLLAHPDPHFLMYVTNYATYLLSSAGFLLSPKCHLTPTNTITWLGKELSASSGISNTPTRLIQLLIHIINLRAFHCSFRSIQRVLGSLQWVAAPFSPVGPWLSPVYHFLFTITHQHIIPLRTLAFLVTAFLYTLIPPRPRRSLLPCVTPPLYVDAAPYKQTFLVSAYKHRSFSTTIQTPNWITTQQEAELYAIFHGLRQALLQNYSSIAIFTDNSSAYYTILHGRVSSSHPIRARILRRIYRLCLRYSLTLQLVWIPSKLNPADIFSRPMTSFQLSALQQTQLPTPFTTHPRFNYASIIPPLFCRSCFPPCVELPV